MSTRKSARGPLLALAIGAFAIGTSEFSPMGLLPVIADGVHVSIPVTGLLISAYAIGVVIGAPIMTLALGRTGKRAALMFLMALFTLGNIIAALAPGYAVLLAGRVITSFSHGAFFGLGAVVAASLVPKERQGSALATMFMGLTIANIGGVPASTWAGQHVGWRAAFAVSAVLGLLTFAALRLALPRGEKGAPANILAELRVLTRGEVLMALATTAMGAGAMFTLYTYVAPVLHRLASASDSEVTLSLVLIGIGFTLGNALGGKLAGWSVDGTAALFLALLAALMLAFPLLVHGPFSTALIMVLWGAAAFGLVPAVQIRVMQAAADAPALASSINIGAFNVGNALGAALGAGVIDLGFGYAAVVMAGGALALAGIALVALGRGRVVGPRPA